MSTSTLTSKGQTTIPKEVREFLQIGPGDSLDFVIHKDREVILRPATLDVADLEGLLARKGQRKVSIPEMNRAIKSRFQKSS